MKRKIGSAADITVVSYVGVLATVCDFELVQITEDCCLVKEGKGHTI